MILYVVNIINKIRPIRFYKCILNFANNLKYDHKGPGGDGYYNLQKQHSTGSAGAGGNGGGGGGGLSFSGPGNSNNGGSNSGGGVVINSEGYSYVNDVPAIQSHHRHSSSGHKSSSSSHREHSQQNRTRRTQRRVTHNEKRYHSG